MPFSIDKNNTSLLREIIMDHYSNPRHKKEVDSSYLSVHMDSASCIDDIYVQMTVEDNIIKEIYWHGEGCAISTASTSIMCELVESKTISEAKKIIENFNNMLNELEFDEELLEEAICFVNVNKQPSRITCANISYRGLTKLLEELNKNEK